MRESMVETEHQDACQKCVDAALAARLSQEKSQRISGLGTSVLQLLTALHHLVPGDWPESMARSNRVLRQQLFCWLRDYHSPKILIHLNELLKGKHLALAGDVIDGAREWVTSGGWFFWFNQDDELVAALSPDGLCWGKSDIVRLLGCLPRVVH